MLLLYVKAGGTTMNVFLAMCRKKRRPCQLADAIAAKEAQRPALEQRMQ
jgi:hypothetical protein